MVDTKYEFGKTADGRIVVIDEIHTPDSSRFWYSKTYDERFSAGKDPESFDKEYVRRWLKERGFSGDGPIPEIPDDVKIEASKRYIEAIETITGPVSGTKTNSCGAFTGPIQFAAFPASAARKMGFAKPISAPGP